MHARELIELAAIVATQGPLLIRSGQHLSESGIEQYWAASKCRLDRWSRALKSFTQRAGTGGPLRREARWLAVEGVFEEILTGEVLTRVWAAVVCAYDRARGEQNAEPVARSVLIGHLEARHRVLTLLVSEPSIAAEQAVKLNHLRRRCERWTDMLVGYLASLDDVSEFAIDPERAKDFADDMRHQMKQRGGRHAWPLVQASLRAAFQQPLAPESPNADLNAQIATAVLACFPAEIFDSVGSLRSLWLWRISNTARDAQGMLDELLDVAPAGHGAGGHTSARVRRF